MKWKKLLIRRNSVLCKDVCPEEIFPCSEAFLEYDST